MFFDQPRPIRSFRELCELNYNPQFAVFLFCLQTKIFETSLTKQLINLSPEERPDIFLQVSIETKEDESETYIEVVGFTIGDNFLRITAENYSTGGIIITKVSEWDSENGRWCHKSVPPMKSYQDNESNPSEYLRDLKRFCENYVSYCNDGQTDNPLITLIEKDPIPNKITTCYN